MPFCFVPNHHFKIYDHCNISRLVEDLKSQSPMHNGQWRRCNNNNDDYGDHEDNDNEDGDGGDESTWSEISVSH
jgi:hypothetical protein